MDDALTHKYLEGEELTRRAEIARPPPRHPAVPDRPGADRLGAQEQGHPADARRGRRLPARRRSTCRRSSASTRRRTRRCSGTVDDGEPFSALAFKIAADPFVGKLAFFRVYSGTLKSGSYVLNSTKGKKERIGRILQMHANHREEIDGGLRGRHRRGRRPQGDLHRRHARRSRPPGDPRVDDLPRAGHRGGDRAQDEGRPGQDGHRPRSASPRRTRRSGSRPTRRRGQTLIAGMGELHLDVLVDRMVREFKVAANIGKPQVVLPRDDPRGRPRATAASSARPAARASTATRSSGSSPARRAPATSSSTRSSAARSRASTSSAIDDGHPRGARDRRLRRATRWSTSR